MPEPPDVLIDQARLSARVRELASGVRADSDPDAVLHVVAALKGAFIFMADFVRAVPGPVTCDFLAVSSYAAGRETSGEVRITKDLDAAIDGRDVVVVEDIVDTGLTLATIQAHVRSRQPARLRTVCLLDKPARRRVAVTIDYVGFTIDDRFVVGYGLDAAERYRNLPYVGVLGADR
ncbi:MAG TPA: hypoxanthine phosphoribosyltransferase [Vicinamibacterales bacterium]|nr:hypoxanthine phosphoribosyltransferase [Vicinamibacterales bacterium]